MTRKDLVSSVEGLWELVESHQARCSYDMLTRYVDALKKSNREKPLKGILDLIEYDINIRELVVQKAGLDPELTDFLFGRPITETLRIYGIKIKKEEGKYILILMR